MSAPVNMAVPPTGAVPAMPGAPGVGGGAQPAQAAGFEALLAGLFGEAAGAASEAGAEELTIDAQSKDGEGEATTDGQAGSLLAMNLVVPAQTQPQTTTPVAGGEVQPEGAMAPAAPATPQTFSQTAAQAAADAADAAAAAGADAQGPGEAATAATDQAADASADAKIMPQASAKPAETLAEPARQSARPAAPPVAQPAAQAPAPAETAAPVPGTGAAPAAEAVAAELAPQPKAETPTPAHGKDKARKGAQVAEPAKADAAPAAARAAAAQPKTDATAVAVDAVTQASEGADGALEKPDAATQGDAALPAAQQGAERLAASPASQAANAVRGAPETVANLAAKIIKKLEERSTRFDLELDPVGLGRVDVRVEIGQHGKMTAAMACDTPEAAAELKARSAELQRALERAGFDISGGISFDVASDRGGARQPPEQHADTGAAFRGRAFQAALANASAADLPAAPINLRRAIRDGVDIRI